MLRFLKSFCLVYYHIEKIGFVREVTETLHGRSDVIAVAVKEAIDTFLSNMKILLTRLATMQRLAERELSSERVTQQLERARNGFLSDHPVTAKREDAVVLFESIEVSLDNSPEADLVRIELQSLKRDFGLADDVTKPIENFPSFCDRLREMKYASQNATQETNGTD